MPLVMPATSSLEPDSGDLSATSGDSTWLPSSSSPEFAAGEFDEDRAALAAEAAEAETPPRFEEVDMRLEDPNTEHIILTKSKLRLATKSSQL